MEAEGESESGTEGVQAHIMGVLDPVIETWAPVAEICLSRRNTTLILPFDTFEETTCWIWLDSTTGSPCRVDVRRDRITLFLESAQAT